MRSGVSVHVWTVALAFVTAVSQPATADDRQECLKASKATAPAAIFACTRAIQSGEYQSRDLSNLYYHRAYARSWTTFPDRVDHAFQDYSEAIRLDAENAGALINRSRIYIQRRDYDRAIADVDQAFKGSLSDDSRAAGYHNRGDAYVGKHEYDRAILEFDQAIRFSPDDAAIFVRRGIAYQSKGDNDRAIADYSESIRLNANNAATFVNRGNAYRAKGDLDRAITDFDQGIALAPKYALAYGDRGIAYSAKGDFDRAIADYDRAIGLNPKSLNAYGNRGNAYHAKGNFDRAVADYDQAILLDPKYVNLYIDRGAAYLAMGDLDRAIASYTQAIALDAKRGNAYYGRAFAYLRKAYVGRAIADHNQAMALDPKIAHQFWSALFSWWPFFAMIGAWVLLKWALRNPRGLGEEDFLSKGLRVAEPNDGDGASAQPETDHAASIEFQYIKADLIAAYCLHRGATRRQMMLSILGIMFSVATIIYLGEKRGEVGYAIVVLTILLSTTLSVSLIYVSLYLTWLARRNIGKYPREFRLALRPEGITLQSSRTIKTLQWADFIRWRTNSKTTLVYVSPGTFIHFPTRLAEFGFPMEHLRAELLRGLGHPLR